MDSDSLSGDSSLNGSLQYPDNSYNHYHPSISPAPSMESTCSTLSSASTNSFPHSATHSHMYLPDTCAEEDVFYNNRHAQSKLQ